MKHLLKAPKMIIKRAYYGRIIKRADAAADQTASADYGGMKDGCLKLRVDEVFGEPGFNQKLINSDLRVTPEGQKKSYLSWKIPEFLWRGVLGSEVLNRVAKGYLGAGARLDDIYVKTVAEGLNSVSEGWHTDQVGYRLKVFMVFDADGEPSGTLVVPHARPNLYEVNWSDEMARILRRPKKENRSEELRVSYTPGDCLIFDTNLLHRGDYTSTKGIRYCVIAEYIDRKKADALRGFAPCGPGQARQKIEIPGMTMEELKAHPLIDPTLLHLEQGRVLYGYA